MQKISNLEKMLKNLGNKENPDVPNAPNMKKIDTQMTGVSASHRYLSSIYKNKLKDVKKS
jgi:hypothetical protein